MLAGKAEDDKLVFPLLASPKLDGVRASVENATLLSRSLKPFANKYTQALFSSNRLHGLDGEFILGQPTAPDVCRQTTAALARIEGSPALSLWVFDDWSLGFDAPFSDRLLAAKERVSDIEDLPVTYLMHTEIRNALQLEEMEDEYVTAGYEGLMIRALRGRYKHGRSTAKEGWLLKVKRYEDAEAEVIGIEEEMHNANEAKTSEVGRTKRSTHAAGLVGKGTVGALVCRGLGGRFDGVQFNIGSGLSAADRARKDWVGKVVRYKYFAVGVKDKPRHPVLIAERMRIDL